MPKWLLNKEGNEIVEASLVLPLVFLVVLSLIGVLIFHFQSFLLQCDIHEDVLTRVDLEASLYKTIEIKQENSLSTGGVFQGLLVRESLHHFSAIDEGGLLRAGGILNELF